MTRFEMPDQSIPKDKQFCPGCGEIKRNKYFEEDSEFCIDCCEKMLHTRVRWYGFPIALVVICFCALAVLLSIKTVPVAELVVRSDSLARECRLTDAFDKIEEAQTLATTDSAALNEKFPKYSWFDTGFHTWDKYFSLMEGSMTRLDAAYTVQSKVNSEMIKAKKLDRFAEYEQITDAYEKMSGGINEITSDASFDTPKDVDYDDVIKKMDALLNSDSNDYERAYNNYFKASVAQYVYGADDERCRKLLAEMVEIMPDEAVIYADVLFETAKSGGDTKELIEICDSLIESNRNAVDAYEFKAKALIYEGDYSGAEKVCEDMKKFNGDNPTYYTLKIMSSLRQNDVKAALKIASKGDAANSEAVDSVFSQYLARNDNISRASEELFKQEFDFSMYQGAAMMLDGNYKGAAELIYNYVYYYAYYYSYITSDQSIITQSIIDMTALSASLAKNEEAMSAVAELGEYSDTVEKIINGKLTLKDVFVDGKAELI